MAGKKILVAEDEAVQLTSVARRLKSAGYEVVGARDGASAISTARKELPDLVLLDLGLPAGDGFTVLKRLQMLIQTTTIPVIVASARDPAGNRDAALKAGAVAYLQKPLETDVLLKAIGDVLGTSESNSPANPA
jgi:DNA-binding response OmpR family regulator